LLLAQVRRGSEGLKNHRLAAMFTLNAVIVGVAAAMAKDLSPTKSNISRPPSSNWPQRTSSAFRMAEMKDDSHVFDT
jgi:hypothetical protein